jgi:hypothetical protein
MKNVMQEVAMSFVWAHKIAAKVVGCVAFGAAATLVFASAADAAKIRKPVRAVQPAITVVPVVPPTCRRADLFPCGPLQFSGVYLGDDPDPFIRSQIWRDLGARVGGED